MVVLCFVFSRRCVRSAAGGFKLWVRLFRDYPRKDRELFVVQSSMMLGAKPNDVIGLVVVLMVTFCF